MSLLPDKYKDIYPLNPGQNAKVFKAVNALLNRPVFLKIYPIPIDDPLSALQEPHLLTRLAHINLTKIFTADPLSDGSSILLEMELLKDGSLDELLQRCISSGRWMSVHKCINVIRDIASGLNHLHSNGYVHRDIKPANVMIRNRGAYMEGVVTDLGLVSKLNADGHAQGSQHARLYRPPEVWAGQPYVKASDLYQLGLVFYQLLGGRLNYKLSDLPDEQLGPSILDNQLVDFDSIGVHANPSLHRLVTSLVCPVEQRIPDCNTLISHLQKLHRDHIDWHLREAVDKITALKSVKKREIQIEIVKQGKTATIQIYERPLNGKWRRKGKSIEVQHKILRRCREVRAIFDK